MSENILQLRNHHLKQGRSNDRKPIYPITKAECIIGDIGGGVQKVNTLPEEGEEGKIYYNTSDMQYYKYDVENGFTNLGIAPMPYGETPSNESNNPDQSIIYTLKPNVYYDFDTFYTTNPLLTPLLARINFADIDAPGIVNSYVFRITIPSTGLGNITLNGLTIPVSTKEILDNLEPTHRYEFNVFGKVLLITDITEESSNG